MPELEEEVLLSLIPVIYAELNKLDKAEIDTLIKLAISSYIEGDGEAATNLKLKTSLNQVHQAALDYATEYRTMLVEKGGSYCSIPILDDDGTIVRIERQFIPWAEEYSKSQRELISATIKQGIKDGRPVDEIAQDLNSIFDNRDRRAEMLVQTESRKHHVEGMKTRYKANKIKEVEWSTAGSDVCPICIQLEGAVFPVDGAPGGGPPAHVNCRCRLLPVIDLEAEIRAMEEG